MSKNFLITNNSGGYLWYTKTPLSRYQGWFLPFDGRMIKVIDSFDGDIDALCFPQFTNTLSIHNKKQTSFQIIFDIRESYTIPIGDRIFTIYEKEGILWVRYNLEPILVGIKLVGTYHVIDDWIRHVYPFDQSRNSPPFSMWVYKGVDVKASSVIIAAGKDEATVMEEIKRCQGEKKKETPWKVNVHDPYKTAANSLLSLRVYDETKTMRGMYAGLPWFFQFWIRDNAIAAKALSFINPAEARSLLTLMYETIGDKSPAYVDLKGTYSTLQGIDGRLFLQWQLKELEVSGGFEEYFNDDFIFNNPKETWMDTISRAGARIENQALKLALLRGSTREQVFYAKVRKHFIDQRLLIDGIELDGRKDLTRRPNVFLAAYIYPELLSPEEWEYTIDRYLEALWLAWGGLSTVEKSHVSFHPYHTGEVHFHGEHNSPASYHQGDSWFWINNIAAIVMYRINEKKYHSYIKKIFHSSTRDLTQKAIIGHASELSFAASFKPTASPVQLWSVSSYMELYKILLG